MLTGAREWLTELPQVLFSGIVVLFRMDKLQQVIEKFKLNVLAIDGVPQSFSSAVYKIKLIDHRIVYIKIPYSKSKLELEYKVLERLRNELPIPQVLNYWEGNEDITGALLLSAINGIPITEKVDAALAYDIGVHHAKLHAIAGFQKFRFQCV